MGSDTADTKRPPMHGPATERLMEQYRQMVRIRVFEETAISSLRAGYAFGSIHPYVGEEAIAAGLLHHTRNDDLVLSTHRGHGHTLVKGAHPSAMLKELFGRVGGTSNGRGGSMHIADFGVGMLGANGVVGANIILAAGAAHGVKMQDTARNVGEGRIVICFLGDGAVNRGPFLEGLNWAQIFALPVLFVCEDNRISAMTDTADKTAGGGPVARAASIGLRTADVDGNNVEAVSEIAERLIAEVRAGSGPAFLHAETYRLLGHTAVDPAKQRDQFEVEAAWKVEPIARARARLLEAGASKAELAVIAEAVSAEMKLAYEEAIAAPYPSPSDAYREVQTLGTPEREAY